jgi:hypothetical protein
MIDVHKRYGNTSKKMISITQEGREAIQTFADAQGMSFSAAIETMALVGMKADLTLLLIPLLREVVQAGLKHNFNRLVKLCLLGAAESAMAHDLVTMLLLQTVRQEAVRHPQDFESRMPVSDDPADLLDFRIREMYERMRRLARKRQQGLLRKPVAALLADYGGAEAAAEPEVNDA